MQGSSPRGRSGLPGQKYRQKFSPCLPRVTQTARITFPSTLTSPGWPSSPEGGLRCGVSEIQDSSWILWMPSGPGGSPSLMTAVSLHAEQVVQTFIFGRNLPPAIPSIGSLYPTPGVPNRLSPQTGSRSSRLVILWFNYGAQRIPLRRFRFPRGARNLSF